MKTEIKFELKTHFGKECYSSSRGKYILCISGLRDYVILPPFSNPKYIYAVFTDCEHPEGFKIQKRSSFFAHVLSLEGYLIDLGDNTKRKLYEMYERGYRYVYIKYDE